MLKQKVIDSCKFVIDGYEFQLQRKVKKIKDVDLLFQLSAATIYPKIYWEERNQPFKRALIGSLLTSSKIPEIESFEACEGDLFYPQFYGGKNFITGKKKDSSFNYFPSISYILPKFELYHDGKDTYQIEYTLDSKFLKSPFMICEGAFERGRKLKILTRTDLPLKLNWNDNINNAVSAIQSKELKKIVLARTTSFAFDKKINPFLFLKTLKKHPKNSSFFCFQFHPYTAFLGATPENLYKRVHNNIYTEAIAGTCRANDNTNLLSSPKEMQEYQYVVDYIQNSLSSICKNVTKTKDSILNIGFVHHLHSSFKGQLKKGITDSKIIDTLHPTPAIAGSPLKKAFQKISHLEPFERNWYSAPLSRISPIETLTIVGIRSCFIEEENLSIFVGNGIVEDSCPEKEWEELEMKISFYFKAIEEYGNK